MKRRIIWYTIRPTDIHLSEESLCNVLSVNYKIPKRKQPLDIS